MIVYNFNAGPSSVPSQVIDATVEALHDFKGTGLPVISISHRSEEWVETMYECHNLWRALLHIPDNYEVLLISGGASMQFLYVAMNLLENKAGYLDTGVWASKALKEAQGIGNAFAIASSSDRDYAYIPQGYVIPDDIDYFHITSNNTVYGTEIKYDMDCPVNLVADMSSDILSRPVDISKYALIYGGAQKNAGTAGVSFVIIDKNILGKVSRHIPTLLDYRTFIDYKSMFNTPSVYSIFIMNETLKWLKGAGGVEEIYNSNIEKADLLYREIDRNHLFKGTADIRDRSIMNVRFIMEKGFENLQDEFIDFAAERGLVGLKGHRIAGGLRASIYNACPVNAVKALVDCMNDFERKYN